MSAAPSSGDRPPLQGMRRSFTTPVRQLSIHEKAGLDKTDADADVLYTHPTARIVSFSPPTDSVKSSNKSDVPADTDYPVDTIETLPWRSRTETLAASGVMMIEKVRGSTNFLKCQDVMHAILRNSQCWCVDGESKFVLRVRKFQYYRIELPSATDENKAKVEELKKVLPTVLRFERTPCPFIRAFTVDLPDDAITPRRKGRWQRRDSTQLTNSDTETPPLRRSKPTRSWSMKSPPTSYPKHGPGQISTFERGRPSSSAESLRRDSFFDSYRNSSPASHVPSEEGTDSEQHESEHSSERESGTDRSETTSPQVGLRDVPASDHPDNSHEAEAKEVQSTPSGSASAILNQDTQAESQKKEVSGSFEKLSDVEPMTRATQEALDTNELRDRRHQKVDSRGPEIENQFPLIASLEAKKSASVPQFLEKGLQESNLQPEQSVRPQMDDAARQVGAGVVTEPTARVVARPTEPRVVSTSEESHEDSTESSAEESTDDSAESSEAEVQRERVSDSDSQLIPDSEAAGAEEHPITIATGEPSPLSSEEASSEDSQDSDESESELGSDRNPQLVHGVQTPPQHVTSSDEVDEHSTPLAANISQNYATKISATRVSRSSEDEREEDDDGDDDDDDDDDDDENDDSDSSSNVSSVDSFHTMASTLHRGSMNENLAISRASLSTLHGSRQHKRGLSELTITASDVSDSTSPKRSPLSRQEVEENQAPVVPQSPVADMSQPGPSKSASPDDDSEGLRQRLKARRSFSPLPPASTIFTGNQIRHDSGGGHMTKAILQKVIVKPIEVVVLLVHILARIAGGATMNDLLSGELFKTPEHGGNVSGFANRLNNAGGNSSDTDDDYGIPIRGRRRSSTRNIVGAFNDGDNDVLEDVD